MSRAFFKLVIFAVAFVVMDGSSDPNDLQEAVPESIEVNIQLSEQQPLADDPKTHR
jgi:hypothetical protein